MYTQRLIELGFIVKRVKEGVINRCATVAHPHKKNGWFKVGDKSVSYGSWDNSIEAGYFWKDEQNFVRLPKEEKIRLQTERNLQQAKLDEEYRYRRIESVNKAFALTRHTKLNHAYLNRKCVDYRNDFRTDFQNRVVIPMRNVIGQLVGYQYIDDEGAKKFKAGSITKGGFYSFQPEGQDYDLWKCDLIFLTEGVATAASVYQSLNEDLEAVDYIVLACFSANNVDVVANEILNKIGRKSIIAIKDYDQAGLSVKTKGFPVAFVEGQDANDIYMNFGKETLSSIIRTRMLEL